ncbi:TPR domain protein [Tamlana nanhaiensis]|uniref:TPR domain protein n=1 Tax=Neotamlana nanhaiensis TaxID=1382798 RepID=A0A0D7W8N2_9FLAO|nr:TPR domain protein [Tamlana nanhaiensis]
MVVLTAVFFVASCSRKKDKFLSRSFHAVTAEFNILYNGQIAFDEGRQALNDAYFDNYWEVLPIERMQVFDEIVLPGQSKNEQFTRAEEKAVKAIQKHSMNIDGKEKNPQIDEAYLLLGKSRYFDQRFIPALEAFNYILYKYPASDKINQAKVWREKTNMRLDNNELAIKNLKRLLKQEELEGQDLADATSILAQAYLNTKVIDTAITLLEVASNATKSSDERGRYRFIQGQLYNELGIKDSANYAFDRVIELNRRIPRIYLISAHLEKIKNFDYENGDKLAAQELLTELEENRENRLFLDKIYHQIGTFHLKNNHDSLAVAYYNKSLRANTVDKVLKAKTYEILGDMNFDATVYAEAGKYYDSTMLNQKLNSKPYRVMKRKRDNLDDVIQYESIAKTNDSILTLINLPEALRLSYFERYIEDLKAKDEAAKEQAEAASDNSNSTGLATAGPQRTGFGPPINLQQGQAALFYFYNPTTLAYGKNEFVKVWGNRPLEDNWRWSSNVAGVSGASNASETKVEALATEDERYDPEFYLAQIPSSEKEIDSIKKDRNFAYYQLGLIYKERFKEYELSKNRFLNLLDSNPEERFILPSKYNLYKLYELLGEEPEAAKLKVDIISSFPESRYAKILTNPDAVSEKDENSPESLYASLFAKHENQEYADVIKTSEAFINDYEGDVLVPKFALLKAMATGRLYGYDAYKEAINNVALTYANTPEGKQAQHIETNVLPRLANADFITDANTNTSGNYKVVFQFKSDNHEKIDAFKTALDEVLEHVRYYNLSSSQDVYDTETTFIVVHGIKSETVAKTFTQLFTDEDQKKIKEPYFTVSSENYQIIQVHKYLNIFLNLNNN